MRFRLKAFAVHIGSSAAALSLVLGALYLGWYHWPGWYLTRVARVAAIMVGVDVALGPLLTLIVANPAKRRAELVRDIGVIVAVQLVALVYGTVTLWQGRPLYYTFSEDRLEMVQAAALTAAEVERGRRENPSLAPHWYSLPRWVYAPLPEDPEERQRIMTSAMIEGQDVIDMPRYFQPWEAGLPALRAKLKRVDEISVFAPSEQRVLKARMRSLGLPADEPVASFMMGQESRLLVVFDPATLAVRTMLTVPESPTDR